MGDTYEAVGVLGPRASPCAFAVAAFADGAPVAAAITLLGTHHLRYWRGGVRKTRPISRESRAGAEGR